MIPLAVVIAVALVIGTAGIVSGVAIIAVSGNRLGMLCGLILFGASLILVISTLPGGAFT